MEQNRIAVIGAGTMGVGIALQYAMYGHRVSLYSRTSATLERAEKTISAACSLLEQEKIIPAGETPAVMERILYTRSLEEAVEGAWYVVETIAERPEEKRELYQQLDALLAEDVILSSNTSYLNVFELIPACRQRNTAIVHWFTPAHIMPLVEIVKGPDTAPEVICRLKELHEQCGKVAVCMERYVPGFLVNRLQSAMTREVLYLLENGYCQPEDIDLAVKTSLMPRGMLLGVVQRMDFGGIDGVANGLRNQTYQPAPAPAPENIITTFVGEGRRGVKSGRGFYDYSHAEYEEVLRRRDEQLLRSVKLAREFLNAPLHRTDEPEC